MIVATEGAPAVVTVHDAVTGVEKGEFVGAAPFRVDAVTISRYAQAWRGVMCDLDAGEWSGWSEDAWGARKGRGSVW